MPTKKTAKKIKSVLIISASFRPNSNSHALCQEVAKGVKAAGNKAEVIRLKDRKIGFCTGCYACQKLGKCVIKDDANAIVEKICKADAVVFGTPVYYFSISGQLKALFDRCVAKWPEPNGKPYYLVATMAENMDWDLVKAPLSLRSRQKNLRGGKNQNDRQQAIRDVLQRGPAQGMEHAQDA